MLAGYPSCRLTNTVEALIKTFVESTKLTANYIVPNIYEANNVSFVKKTYFKCILVTQKTLTIHIVTDIG